jgi:hypothetical protein
MLSSHAAAFLASSANVDSSAAAASASSSSAAATPASSSSSSPAAAAAVATAAASAAAAAPAKPAAGVVLFSACCDWDCSTRPDALGLDRPHRVPLPCPIAAGTSLSVCALVVVVVIGCEGEGTVNTRHSYFSHIKQTYVRVESTIWIRLFLNIVSLDCLNAMLPAAFSSSSAAHLFLLSASTEPLGQRLFACGRNERGQLGTGAVTAKAAQMPVEIQRFAPAGETIVKVCTSTVFAL